MKKFYIFVSLAIILTCTSNQQVKQTNTQDDLQNALFLNPDAPIDKRVDDLVSRLTIKEKIAQLGQNVPSISRLKLRKYLYWNEALHGIARDRGKATVFPQSIALGASWDPGLVYRVASAISDEARGMYNGMGKELTFFSPTVNLLRDPRWGRNEESYSEDPYLLSQMGVQYVKGMQGSHPVYLKTVTTAKHYIANNSEFNRHTGSSIMDERCLREYYLPAFKALVEQGKTYSVMTSYNAITIPSLGLDHQPTSTSSYLLEKILRGEMNFQGYVVTDCGAIKDIHLKHKYAKSGELAVKQALEAGVDLNCGGYYKKYLGNALEQRLVTEKQISKALKRVFKARFLLGEFDPPDKVPYSSISADVIDSGPNRALALEAAEKSIVLLKNSNNFLPLDRKKIQSVAVIGPFGDELVYGSYSGGSSFVKTTYDGIYEYFNDEQDRLDAEDFDEQHGIEIMDKRKIGKVQDGDWIAFNNINLNGKTKILTATTTLRRSPGGIIEIRLGSLEGDMIGKIIVPSSRIDIWNKTYADITPVEGKHKVYFVFRGKGNKKVNDIFHVDFFRFLPEDKPPQVTVSYTKGCHVAGHMDEEMFAEAAASARKADIAIVAVGHDKTIAKENRDRKTGIELPGAQEYLVKAVFKANPKTIVVLVTGGPMAIPWINDNVPAILCPHYGGQSQGTATAKAIFGDINPAGKLTQTWFESSNDLPDFKDYNIFNERTYMYFSGKPLYPFGYGLSYTNFSYSELKINAETISPGKPLVIKVKITNTGTRKGDEIVQMYFHDPKSSVKMPHKALKGFTRISLDPGSSKTVSFSLNYQDLSYWDSKKSKFVVEDGEIEVMVGASSADIRLKANVTAKSGK